MGILRPLVGAEELGMPIGELGGGQVEAALVLAGKELTFLLTRIVYTTDIKKPFSLEFSHKPRAYSGQFKRNQTGLNKNRKI